MASNFRGTGRKTYNPSEVKYLTDNEIRREYAALRKVANRRAGRLRAAGFEGTELAEKHFPAQSSLSDEEAKYQLLEVSRFIRDPRTFVKGMKEYDTAIKESLRKYADVIAKNPKKFGDFMETLRRRAGGRLKESARVRVVYEEAISRGIRPKTLEKHFSDYLNDKDKLEKLAETLQTFPTGGRLKYRQVLDAL